MNDLANQHFEILAPRQWTAPVIVNSPHSGSLLPPSFLTLSQLSISQLRSSEDSHIDELFLGCLDVGVPMVRALVSRSYLDLNREPFELDARMFDVALPDHMNTTSSRVACGLGTIPKTVGDGLNIYAGPIALQDALNRIETIHRPYHRMLAALVEEAHSATGTVVLADCHSMPSSAVSKGHQKADSADIVLGDRFGRACDGLVVSEVSNLLKAAGLNVAHNKPYAGGFITETHGNPRQGRHAFQIEINRATYMNEVTREKNGGFAPLKSVLDMLLKHLATIATALADENPIQLAAE